MEFIRFIIISALFFGTLFLYLKMKQPKTIWLGISFLISVFHLALITVILLLNAELDVDCVGFGSKSKFYFSLNAFLREFVAYLEMTYKVHLSMIGLVALFFFGIYFITTFLIGTN